MVGWEEQEAEAKGCDEEGSVEERRATGKSEKRGKGENKKFIELVVSIWIKTGK